MTSSNTSNVDFAALRMLQMVHDRRSFTATAIALDVNQSVVSYTIDKLRKVFDDPLFFRQGGQVVPTERCSAIVESATALLEQYDRLIEPASFDPATAEQGLTIACNYYERQLILPHVIRAMRKAAPGIRLNAINSSAQGDIQLKQSEADLLIGPLRPDVSDFYCRKLLDEHYVCVVDADSPLATKPMTMADYATCNHVAVTYGGLWKSRFLIELEEMGVTLNNVVSVPSPAGLGSAIAGTDLVATVPSRIAQTYPASVRVIPCPCPAPFEIDLVWTTRTHHSPMHIWMRNLVSEQIKRNLNQKAA